MQRAKLYAWPAAQRLGGAPVKTYRQGRHIVDVMSRASVVASRQGLVCLPCNRNRYS